MELFTERLHLRPFCAVDFEAHARISADPEVMRHIPPGSMSRVDAWRQMAQYIGHYQLLGYGILAVIERLSQKLIGRIGLMNPEGGNGPEIGWALARESWGKGYALEGAHAALDYGFSVLDWNYVSALIHPENERSIKIAEKLGGKLKNNLEQAHGPVAIYAINRTDIGLGNNFDKL